jgi:formylglycine-generating enzyme required for sulfatase activity
MADIFLSYAREDRPRVEPLARALEAEGWTIWWDRRMRPGKTVEEVIQEELQAAKAVVVVWSTDSVSSHWVLEEATEGRDRRILFPIKIANVTPPLGFKRLHASDLIAWEGNRADPEFANLIDSLSSALGAPATMQESSPTAQRARTPRHREKPAPPAGMVLVPKGAFQYGDERNLCPLDYDYYIDIYPVTNGQYKKFVEAGGYANREHWSEKGWKWREANGVMLLEHWDNSKWNERDHPVEEVSWYEAEAYAKWAGKRLPTEEEWEKAARGTDGHPYPWGDMFGKEKCNSAEAAIGGTTPVTKYVNGLSPYGCYDMAGNVWEWTSSNYDNSGNSKVLRGGSWGDKSLRVRSAFRGNNNPMVRSGAIGFRCAQDAEKNAEG